jgi:hypothetical protein
MGATLANETRLGSELVPKMTWPCDENDIKSEGETLSQRPLRTAEILTF